MALNIPTFSNQSGGNAFYKAVTHPLAADKARHLVVHLQKAVDLDPKDRDAQQALQEAMAQKHFKEESVKAQ